MRRHIAMAVFVLLSFVPMASWAISGGFSPNGPFGSSVLSVDYDMPTHIFSIQGPFGQGPSPALWQIDGAPLYQDIEAQFSLEALIHMDGTLESGSIALVGVSPSAGLLTPLALFTGTLPATTLDPYAGTWTFTGAVSALAEPFAGQVGYPSTFTTTVTVGSYWNWDPFSLQGEPVILFESNPAPVPEPGTWMLLLTGIAFASGYGLWRKQ